MTTARDRADEPVRGGDRDASAASPEASRALFPRLQGPERTWYCGAHTLVNSQEHCRVSGLAVARQLGADYPFADDEARRWFNFYGRMVIGRSFRRA